MDVSFNHENCVLSNLDEYISMCTWWLMLLHYLGETFGANTLLQSPRPCAEPSPTVHEWEKGTDTKCLQLYQIMTYHRFTQFMHHLLFPIPPTQYNQQVTCPTQFKSQSAITCSTTITASKSQRQSLSVSQKVKDTFPDENLFPQTLRKGNYIKTVLKICNWHCTVLLLCNKQTSDGISFNYSSGRIFCGSNA